MEIAVKVLFSLLTVAALSLFCLAGCSSTTECKCQCQCPHGCMRHKCNCCEHCECGGKCGKDCKCAGKKSPAPLPKK